MRKPSKLEKHIDEIYLKLYEGATFKSIADDYDVAISTLHEFINKPEYSARTQNALAISASSYANKGEQVLLDAEKDRIEIQRARELAQHYRWMAGKRNPKKYGEAQLLKIADNEGNKMKQNVLFPTSPIILKDVQTDNGISEDMPDDQTD